jgi:hypothetical protein
VFHRQTYSAHHVINIKIKQNQHSVEGLLHQNIFALSVIVVEMTAFAVFWQ